MSKSRASRSLTLGGLAALLAACGSEAPADTPREEATEIPEELAQADEPPAAIEGDSIGTPREDRVATLGLINKRNNVSREIEIKPGEQRRFGNVVLRLATCERTPPWENPPETGAFVQVNVRENTGDGEGEWTRVFSGWLFRNSPGLNVVEHPIYDVWVKDCAMSFPGEEDAPAPAAAAVDSDA